MSKQKSWTGERLETQVFNEATIEHLHRYAIACELAAGKTVLDIACGEGYGSNLLADKAASVTGMDADNTTIEKAAAKYKRANLTFKTCRAEKIAAADHTFDLVVSFETLEHLQDHDAMLSEIKRVLKPGGLLLISTPEKKNYSDKTGYQNPFHTKELYQHELEALLKRSFERVTVYGQEITHSSLITSAASEGLAQYRGNFTGVEKNPATAPLYLVALASDNELPVLPNSLFSGNSILEQALAAKEAMVTSTITYRAGHILLYPFKLIRKLLKK